MCEQHASHLAKHSELEPNKYTQNLSENYSKITKIAITACKFSKIFRRACLRTPLELFLVFQSALNLFCRKKNTRKNVEIMPPPPFKITRYAIALSTHCVGYSQMTAHC